MSHEQEKNQQEILAKHTQRFGEHLEDQIFFNEQNVISYEKEIELLKKAKDDLFDEIEKSPTLTKIINNPEKYLDNESGQSVEDIKKWINELDQEIHQITLKIKKLQINIEKLKKLDIDRPELN